MHITYVFNGCSDKKYTEYVEKRGMRTSQQMQKYNRLLMDGFIANGAAVSALSSRPINRKMTKQVFFRAEKETENGIEYSYHAFFNLPVLRNITVFFGVFFRLLFGRYNKKEDVIICDALAIAPAMATVAASKLRGISAVGIVTDVPCHRPHGGKAPMYERINLRVMKHFSQYLLLTEQMNEIVNPHQRPYIVLEGHSDAALRDVKNELAKKSHPRVCLYAGTLRKIYGIEMLVKGFIKADIPDTELHIYGAGNFHDELTALAEQYPNIRYFGIAPNAEVVQKELLATLLVNPRPTDADYTKYSFPSKNMEYMASGTPVLTTRLPGMPKEYEPFVFLIEEETEDGISEALRTVFSHSDEELHERGARAKEFVMNEKSNIVQAKKVLVFIGDHVR